MPIYTELWFSFLPKVQSDFTKLKCHCNIVFLDKGVRNQKIDGGRAKDRGRERREQRQGQEWK